MRPSPDLGDALKTPDLSRQLGEVGQHIQTQLNATLDVKAAHTWVQPTGGEAHLPSMAFGGDGASLSAVVPGGEQHAMAAAQQVGNQAISPIIQMIMKMPGHIGLISSFFEALSSFFAPLQDMIAGLDASTFFASQAEAAANALHSTGQNLGLDMSLIPHDAPIFMMDDGGGGFASLVPKDGLAGFHKGLDLKFNPSEPLDHGGSALHTSGYSDGGMQFEKIPQGMEAASTHVRDGVVSPNFLAMDNGQAIFRPTMGGMNNNFYSSPITAPSNVPTTTTSPIIHPLTHQIAPHHPVNMPSVAKEAAPVQDAPMTTLPERSPMMFEHSAQPAQPAPEATANQGSLLGHPRVEHSIDQVTSEHAAPVESTQAQATTPDGTQGTEQMADGSQAAPEAGADATTPYTVKPGDNLWDIAQKHFGDGLKWQDIYHLNQDIIGADPRMIAPGLELKLPGMNGQELASNYTVQPGDNLWNISKSHLGGGEHWSNLYQQNTDVIGSNPSMIHPGQHLSMNGSEHAGQQLASAAPSHAVQQVTQHAAHQATQHVANHAQHAQPVAHTSHAQHAQHAQPVAHTSHAPAHHLAQNPGVADHAKIAQATPQAEVPQVAAAAKPTEVIATAPAGQEVGLHASAPMGSLDAH